MNEGKALGPRSEGFAVRQVSAGLRYSQCYRRYGSEQAEDERSQAEHDNRTQRQRPPQHCERWQAHCRQGNEQCGGTSPPSPNCCKTWMIGTSPAVGMTKSVPAAASAGVSQRA